MAKWVHTDVLDNGLNKIKTDCTALLLIKAYSAGDSYATVDGNKIATQARSSSDLTLSGSSNRTLTSAAANGVSVSANSGASPNLHFAFVDVTNTKVLWVTDETTDQVMTSGNTANFPALTYTMNQPT